jgi:CO/xanthine dehydrogenase FAD-binding subunit
MRTAVSSLAMLEPGSLKDALRMLRDEPLTPLAGATDLYVALNAGTLESNRFLNLWGLEPLRRIAMVDGVLSIGALASYSAMIQSRLVRRHLPMLVAAAREIGGMQIQNRGTLGGNVANGSPAGDTLPILAVAEALVVLRSHDQVRRVPFTEFYTGYRRTVRRPDELIVALEIPPLEGAQWFRKVGTRAAQAISKVVMAAVRAPRPRIALGSVAPTVIRLRRTEAVLANADIPETGRLDAAAGTLGEDIHPIDDLRSTAEYRRNVAANLLRRFWAETA